MPVNIKTVRKTTPRPPLLRTAPLLTKISAQSQPSQPAASTDAHAAQIPISSRPPLVRPTAFPSLQSGETIGQRWAKMPADDLHRVMMEQLFKGDVVGGPEASSERVLGMYRCADQYNLTPYQVLWYEEWRKLLETPPGRAAIRRMASAKHKFMRLFGPVRNEIIGNIMEALTKTGIDESYAYEALLGVSEADFRSLKVAGHWDFSIESMDDKWCESRMKHTGSNHPEWPFLDELVMAVLFLMNRALPGNILGDWQKLPFEFLPMPRSLDDAPAQGPRGGDSGGNGPSSGPRGGSGPKSDGPDGSKKRARSRTNTGETQDSGYRSSSHQYEMGTEDTQLPSLTSFGLQSTDSLPQSNATFVKNARRESNVNFVKNGKLDAIIFRKSHAGDPQERQRPITIDSAERSTSPQPEPLSTGDARQPSEQRRCRTPEVRQTCSDNPPRAAPQPHSNTTEGKKPKTVLDAGNEGIPRLSVPLSGSTKLSKRKVGELDNEDKAKPMRTDDHRKAGETTRNIASLTRSPKRMRTTPGQEHYGMGPLTDSPIQLESSIGQHQQARSSSFSISTGPSIYAMDNALQSPFLQGGAETPHSPRDLPQPVRADRMRHASQRSRPDQQSSGIGKSLQQKRELGTPPMAHRKNDGKASRPTQSSNGRNSSTNSTEAGENPYAATARSTAGHSSSVHVAPPQGRPNQLSTPANSFPPRGIARNQQVRYLGMRHGSQTPNAVLNRRNYLSNTLHRHLTGGSDDNSVYAMDSSNAATWAKQPARVSSQQASFNGSPYQPDAVAASTSMESPSMLGAMSSPQQSANLLSKRKRQDGIQLGCSRNNAIFVDPDVAQKKRHAGVATPTVPHMRPTSQADMVSHLASASLAQTYHNVRRGNSAFPFINTTNQDLSSFGVQQGFETSGMGMQPGAMGINVPSPHFQSNNLYPATNKAQHETSINGTMSHQVPNPQGSRLFWMSDGSQVSLSPQQYLRLVQQQQMARNRAMAATMAPLPTGEFAMPN